MSTIGKCKLFLIYDCDHFHGTGYIFRKRNIVRDAMGLGFRIQLKYRTQTPSERL